VNFLPTLIAGTQTVNELLSLALSTLKALGHVAQGRQWLLTKTVKSVVPSVADAWKALLSQKRWQFCQVNNQVVLLRSDIQMMKHSLLVSHAVASSTFSFSHSNGDHEFVPDIF
jgi:hypothetical protein